MSDYSCDDISTDTCILPSQYPELDMISISSPSKRAAKFACIYQPSMIMLEDERQDKYRPAQTIFPGNNVMKSVRKNTDLNPCRPWALPGWPRSRNKSGCPVGAEVEAANASSRPPPPSLPDKLPPRSDAKSGSKHEIDTCSSGLPHMCWKEGSGRVALLRASGQKA